MRIMIFETCYHLQVRTLLRTPISFQTKNAQTLIVKKRKWLANETAIINALITKSRFFRREKFVPVKRPIKTECCESFLAVDDEYRSGAPELTERPNAAMRLSQIEHIENDCNAQNRTAHCVMYSNLLRSSLMVSVKWTRWDRTLSIFCYFYSIVVRFR